MARKGNNKSSLLEIIIGLVLLALIIFAGSRLDTSIINDFLNIESNSLENVETLPSQNTTPTAVDGNLVIDYIDVGQGDSILIRQGEHAMLIDGGTSESKVTVYWF